MTEFYALRYLPSVDLKHRVHADTLGRFTTHDEAERTRRGRPSADLLEVVVRGEER